MKVVLFGATGFSGSAVLQKLIESGHEVLAPVRSASKISDSSPKLSIREGNIMDPHFLTEVIHGSDAVINCLGIGGKGSGTANSFVSEANRKIIQAMEEANVPRLIAMSNVGAGDSWEHQSWFFRQVLLPFFMKWLKAIIDDKNVMEADIMKSHLDWTILRFPNIVDKPAKNKVRSSVSGKGIGLSISREDLADFLVQQLDNNTFLQKSPSISN